MMAKKKWSRNWPQSVQNKKLLKSLRGAGFVCLAALSVAGCLGTGMSAVDTATPQGPLATSGKTPQARTDQGQVPAQATQNPTSQNAVGQGAGTGANTPNAQGVRANIEKKVREDYLPSQIGRSIRELNVDNSAQNYPVIADPEQQERRLLTEQERKRIEEELRSLSDG